MAKKSKYSILIICEGENTEPLFFGAIRDEIKNGTYEIGDVEITIRPEPNVEETEDESSSPHKPARKKLQLRSATIGIEPIVIKGIPPLKWVKEGQTELEDGTFNEVWAVFDHDNHPARKEAFEASEEKIDGKKVQIAFSSISFEYYLLLHFERLFKQFQKSECREKKKPINCNSGVHKDDCFGNICIGGYARKNEYWIDSKNSTSVFHLIKEKLEIGFENAAWLRHFSEINEPNIPIYNRNPYITTDTIVKRLVGKDDITWVWISSDLEYTFKKLKIQIIDNQKIAVCNCDKSAVIIPENSFCKVVPFENTRQNFGNRLFLEPTEIQEIDLSDYKSNQHEWFLFRYENYIIMFDFNQQTD